MADMEPVTMLLVEDDPGHARLIERNLRRAGITNAIMTFSDGQAAVDYLCGEGLDRPLSLLILLDLNLPGLSGFQVLERLKADTRTKHIPVMYHLKNLGLKAYALAYCYDRGTLA